MNISMITILKINFNSFVRALFKILLSLETRIIEIVLLF